MGAPGRSAPPDKEVDTFRSGRSSATPPDLRLLHYNDVYHLDPSSAEPVGGVARFITACNDYQSGERFGGQPKLITLFSGDVFNPSLESSVTKGSHMIPILNKIRTDCACVGNHDLDFGVRQFRYLAGKCEFPWLLANVLDPALGENVPLGNAGRTHIITASNGIKVGIIGLGEREWLETINALPPDLIYRSATEVAKELVPQMRAQGAEIIVALTHMREPNDKKLAERMGGEIDIILGGHDHFYSHSFINGTHVLRSGSDFKQLSYIEARRRPDAAGKWDFEIWQRDIVSSIPEDEETLGLVDTLTAKLKKSLEKPVGWTAAPLDARFTTVRLRESNLGNLVCDIMRHHYEAECSIMASGTIRGDQIYQPGPIRVKDITDCFPFEDPVVVIKATGKAILEALENGVSLYPALEGRFPQVSNIRFEFDPSKPAGSRITIAEIGGSPIDLERVYVLATRGYMTRGKDGYKSLLVQDEGGACEEIVSEENGILISMMLRQYFMALKVLGQWMHWGPSQHHHWTRVASGVEESHPVIQPKPSQPANSASSTALEGSPPMKKRRAGWEGWSAAEIRSRRASVAPFDEHDDSHAESPSQSPRPQIHPESHDVRLDDWELQVMRKFFRKWTRAAKVHSQAGDCLHEDDVVVDWTKAVSPRVEGRITCLSPISTKE